MDRLVDSAVPSLERAMRFRVARQGVLAANVANADTPGYRRVELEFDRRFAAAVRRTDPGHAAGTRGPDGAWRVKTEPRSARADGNGVSLDREIVTLSRNAGAFTRQAAVLSRLLAIARMAVSGEAR